MHFNLFLTSLLSAMIPLSMSFASIGRIFRPRAKFLRFLSTNIGDKSVVSITDPLFHATTIEQAHGIAQELLNSCDVPDVEDSSRHILSHICRLGTRRSDFQQSLHKPISTANLQEFCSAISRRMKREPVQYIIGEWDFYGSTFLCKSPILIPRPETEELVEMVTAASKNSPTPLRILDVGCGTGAIGISLLKELDGKCASVTAVDVNSKAVELARQNADRLLRDDARSKYHCLHSSMKSFGEDQGNWNMFDMIVSNPPYIPSVEVPGLQPEVAKYEDPIALDGGTDGLDIVRDILYAGKKLLDKNGGMDIWLEVHETHPVIIDSLCTTSSTTGSVFAAYQSFGPIKDIFSNYRFNHLRLKR